MTRRERLFGGLVGAVCGIACGVTRQTLPDSRFIDFTYDLRGNLTSLTPPGQPAHVFRYTLLDQEGEYDPPPVDPNDPRTFFTCDLDKNLTQVARPDGKTVDLGYDTAGRLSTVTTPRRPARSRRPRRSG